MVTVFANDPGGGGSISGLAIPKTCLTLSIKRNGSRIIGAIQGRCSESGHYHVTKMD